MYKLNEFEFSATEVATMVGKGFQGKDITVNSVQNLNSPKANSMLMCYESNKHLLEEITVDSLVFCTQETIVNNNKLSYVITDSPKFDFFDFINNYLLSDTNYWVTETISLTSENFPGVRFGYNVQVGKNVVIAPGTEVGANCIIGCNVVIRSNVSIGENCVIKDNTVIGSEGFGYTKLEGKIIHVPQIGHINIGNGVVVGSNCTVERPALGETVISNQVKIDDLVQIGHNQFIGENTIIASGFKSVGGGHIGSNCFIGIGAIVTSKKVRIADDCLIGAGAIITKSIDSGFVAYSRTDLIVEKDTNKLVSLVGTSSTSKRN